MSYKELLRAFTTVTSREGGSDLLQECLRSVTSAETTNADVVAQSLAEVTAIGCEDLTKKVTEATRAAVAVDMEKAMKKDLVAFLEGLSLSSLRKISREIGIHDSKADADLLRVKIFEETLLLGCEGFLESQHKPTLVKFVELLLEEGGSDASIAKHYVSKSKEQIVELIMCDIFSLSPPEEEAVVLIEPENEREGSKKRSQRGGDGDDDAGDDDDGDDANPGDDDDDDDDDDGDDESVSSVLKHHRSAVTRMKVADLRSYCAQYGLSEDGLKTELVERVFAHMSGTAASGSITSSSGGSGGRGSKKRGTGK